MAPFPPGKGGGKGVDYGYKGKGVLIHCYTDANGMPLAATVTAANGDERQQVLPLIDAVKIKTGRVGRPPKRVAVLACDKGYDANELRRNVRRRGIRPQMPKRRRPGGKRRRGRPIKKAVPRFQAERTFSWMQRAYRRLVVRWERKPEVFDAFLNLAICHMWMRRILKG